MRGLDPSPEEVFPTHGVLDEDRQVGREKAMDDIADRLIDGDDLFIAQPRRIGKTSTIRNGALPRVRDLYDGIIAQVDLRAAGIEDDPLALSEQLMITAIATGADSQMSKPALKRLSARTKRFVHGDRAKALAQLTDETAALKATQAVATVLAGAAQNPILELRRLLAALEANAQKGRPVVVFIDEAQELAAERWPTYGRAVQDELARALRRDHRLVCFVLCGSEKHALEELFAAGQPLHNEGEHYKLPAIAVADWTSDTITRFAEDGRVISTEHVAAVLAETGGHPGRTMRVCKALLRMVRTLDERTVNTALVDQAVAEAKEHPAWAD